MSMNRLFAAASAAVLAFQFAVFGVSAQERELRDVAGFDSISVANGIDVQIRIGDEFRVEVDANEPERVITSVRGDTLEIGYERERWLGFRLSVGSSGDVFVTLPELRSLSVSGGSDVESVGILTGGSLEIRASGGSDVALEVDVAELEVSTSGGSDVDLTGRAGFVSVSSSGGSDFRADELTADEADLRSSGGSDVSITVRERLVARASGGSDIVYRGQPGEVDVDTSGGADIRGRR